LITPSLVTPSLVTPSLVFGHGAFEAGQVPCPKEPLIIHKSVNVAHIRPFTREVLFCNSRTLLQSLRCRDADKLSSWLRQQKSGLACTVSLGAWCCPSRITESGHLCIRQTKTGLVCDRGCSTCDPFSWPIHQSFPPYTMLATPRLTPCPVLHTVRHDTTQQANTRNR
jgi:hypothetical protein